MRMFMIALSVAILFMQTTSLQAGAKALDKKLWHFDLQKAHAVAQAENKPMLVVFGAEWCKFCKKLEEETLTDPELETFLRSNFVLVYLDLDEQGKVGRILEVKSVPCTVVLSPKADLLGRIVGFKTSTALQEQLEKTLQANTVLKQASGETLLK